MQTKQLVQASAEVITIIALHAGDVFKRLIKRSYGAEQYEAYYGIVQSVDSNGEDTMITAIEITPEAVKVSVFGTDSDVALFATSPEEVDVAILATRRALTYKVDAAERALTLAQQEMRNLERAATQLPEARTPYSLTAVAE